MLIPNIPQIDKRNWFWLVATNSGSVYSSAANAYVPLNDPAYTAWLADGYTATNLSNEEELWSSVSEIFPDIVYDGVISFVRPTATTYSKDQLKDYAALKRYAKETAGITFGAGNTFIATDRTSQTMISGMFSMAIADATFTTKFKTARGKFVNLTATQIINAAKAVGAYVAACFAAEATVVAAIDAGTVTTKAQIDAAIDAVT